MSPFKSRDFEDRPLLVIWEMTQACDLRCVHCRASDLYAVVQYAHRRLENNGTHPHFVAGQGKATPDSQRFRIRLAGWSQRLPAPLERPHPTRTPPGAAKSSPNKERGQAMTKIMKTETLPRLLCVALQRRAVI